MEMKNFKQFYNIKDINIKRKKDDVYSITINADVTDDDNNVAENVIFTANNCVLKNGQLRLLVEEEYTPHHLSLNPYSTAFLNRSFKLPVGLEFDLMMNKKEDYFFKFECNSENETKTKEYQSNLEYCQKLHKGIIAQIKQKELELNMLKDQENKMKNVIRKEKIEKTLNKDVLVKEDFKNIFDKNNNFVRVYPYYLIENGKGLNAILVVDGIKCNYFYLNDENDIISTYNINDELPKKLIGKRVDLMSFEGDRIEGTRHEKVGKVQLGRFIIEKEYR
jgi:hypothetical protein